MNVLLKGAVAMLWTSLALAWVATFSRLIIVRPVQARIKDSGAMVKAHIDLLLMSMLCMAFYAIRVPLPAAACWMVVVGGFTNPSLFVLRALNTEAPISRARKAFRLASFITTTVGQAWVGYSILQAVT